MRLRASWVMATVGSLALPAAARADSTPNSFKTICSLATAVSPHRIDPILAPGVQPFGRANEFFGNTRITDTSSGSQLQTAGAQIHTSCADRLDTAAYWVPVLYRDGARVPPIGMDVYYQRVLGLRRSDGSRFGSVIRFPTDFRVLAGNARASRPQKESVVFWKCLNNSRQGTLPPSCPHSSNPLAATVFLPGCWRGRRSPRLPNNTDDAAYFSVSGRVKKCPAGYDTAIPRIFMTIRYGPSPRGDCRLHRRRKHGSHRRREPCSHYSLSSGSIYSMQAEFLNGWVIGSGEKGLSGLLAWCLNVPAGTRACGTIQTRPTGDAFTGIQ